MKSHEFIPISAVQGHLCGVKFLVADDSTAYAYCALPASADIHYQPERVRVAQRPITGNSRASGKSRAWIESDGTLVLMMGTR
jgi:hypothetical protein